MTARTLTDKLFRGMELALNNSGLTVATHAIGQRGTDYKNADPIAFARSARPDLSRINLS